MYQYQPLTPKTLVILLFIKNNPNCTQRQIIDFMGERPDTQIKIYKLMSRKMIKQKLGKGNRRHYSVDKRKKL